MCRKIVKYCGYSPLAIRSVASTIKSGFISPEMLAENLRSRKNTPTFTEVSKCLDSTFNTLEKSYKEKLVKFSVFHTAKFEVAAAATVLGEPSLDEKNPVCMKTKMDMIYLKSRHLIEVGDLSLRANQPVQALRSKHLEYSLHPMVYEFLKFKINEEEQFQRVECDAKIKFVEYFERKISVIGGKMDKDCVGSQRLFKDNRVHVQNFYDTVLKLGSKDRKVETGSERLLISKRMHELADLIVDDFKKFDLLKKWIADAEERKHMLEAAHCKIFLAQKYFETDRNELAMDMLSDIWNKVLPKVKAAPTEWRPVLGAFYYLRGRIQIRESKFDQALEDLENAEENFAKVRKTYRLELAHVFNSIGCVFYKRPNADIEKSRYYHERAFRNALKIVQNYNNIDLPCYVNNIGTCHYKEGIKLEEDGSKELAKEKYERAVKFYDFALKLDMQFNMHEFDGFAQKLRCRAEAYARLGRTEKAEDDIERAMDLRRDNFTPPHEFITVTQHKVGDIKRMAGMKLYKEGKKCKCYCAIFI